MKRILQLLQLRRGFCPWLLLPFLSVQLFAATALPEVDQLPAHDAVPDPLVMLDGTRVTNRKQWFHERRPELKRLFEHYEYGTMPPAPEHLTVKVDRVDRDFFSGKATAKQITLGISDMTNAPRIHLLLVIPNRSVKAKGVAVGSGAQKLFSSAKDKRGFPVFVGMNFCGNFELLTNREIALPAVWMEKNCPSCVDNQATEAGRGKQTNIWCIEQSIDRGYAVATYYCGDVEPDRTNSTTGIRAFLGSDSEKPAPKDCGVIMAWAWGISRAVDYLITDPDIDAKRIAVAGHSRLGKAAVVAGAFDERIAMVVPLQAGTGGTAPSRGTTGESVKAINGRFPHWFNDEFKRFNDAPTKLPIEQNCLLALVAPRPVLIGCANGDSWSNPVGQFEMMQAADPVYRFLSAEGLATKKMPDVNQLSAGQLGYFIRPGKHSMTGVDWKFILDYADKMMPQK